MDATPQTQPRSQRSRLRILEAAVGLLGRRGLDALTFKEVADEADVSVGLVCRYFPSKEHFALALYERLALELEAAASEMPEGTMAERFRWSMEKKLALIAPHERTLVALAARAIDPLARASLLGPATEVVRSRVMGVVWLAVAGASDAPSALEAASLVRLLYGVHLVILLLFLQEPGKQARGSSELLAMVEAALAMPNLTLPLLASPALSRVHALTSRFFASARAGERDARTDARARVVLARVFRRRRVLPGADAEPTEAALALHLPRVMAFIEQKQPIQLVLPAFPAKSPNRQKVLGTLPDAAEWHALRELVSLLDDIQEAYRPGATLTICSDGHVFADVVGVADSDVSLYRRALAAMIAELETDRVRIFDLGDAFGACPPAEARRLLFDAHAPSVDEIRERAARSPSHLAQLDGIHRFLFEDGVARHPERSRSKVRKDTRLDAYEVVRRSEAWGALVAAAFSSALRLSIHPQPDVSPKIGIALLSSGDAWLTPWHGTAVLEGDRVRLMRRAEADAMGAVVVEEDGRPSYMEVRT